VKNKKTETPKAKKSTALKDLMKEFKSDMKVKGVDLKAMNSTAVATVLQDWLEKRSAIISP